MDETNLHAGLDAGLDGGAPPAGTGPSPVSARSQAIGRLSARERQVLELFADGLTGAEVARALYLSPETVRTHTRNAMRKLSARTRTHAVVMLVRDGGDAPVTAAPPGVTAAPPADGRPPADA